MQRFHSFDDVELAYADVGDGRAGLLAPRFRRRPRLELGRHGRRRQPRRRRSPRDRTGRAGSRAVVQAARSRGLRRRRHGPRRSGVDGSPRRDLRRRRGLLDGGNRRRPTRRRANPEFARSSSVAWAGSGAANSDRSGRCRSPTPSRPMSRTTIQSPVAAALPTFRRQYGCRSTGTRGDSAVATTVRPRTSRRSRCPTLILVGDADQLAGSPEALAEANPRCHVPHADGEPPQRRARSAVQFSIVDLRQLDGVTRRDSGEELAQRPPAGEVDSHTAPR